MVPLKVLVTGGVGAGKTTLVSALSEKEGVHTDAVRHASSDPEKQTTTVAFDYGQLTIDGTPVRLFGTPGQKRFDYMWEVLCEGIDGIVVLVHTAQPDVISYTTELLDIIQEGQQDVPFVVGLTHTDRPAADPARIKEAVFAQQAKAVHRVDARDADSSRSLMTTLIDHVV